MNKCAVLHIPMSQYAYGLDETHVTIRIRTAKDDIKKCTLFFGDRACRQTPVIFSNAPMKIVAKSILFDYFEVTLENAYKRLCYYFELDDGLEKTYFYGDIFTNQLVDDRSEYYQFPFNHRADIVTPPSWAKNAIIYNIFPDSFATSKCHISKEGKTAEFGTHLTKGKLGGTISGISDNVDYLEELGVNAIYINPIFAAGEYHKYDLLDYYHVDPCFGTNEDFAKLVEICHEHGIKVIIDGVFNHCGWKFFAFDDVVKNGENSKYKDWFYGLKFPVVRPENPETYPDYECFGYERLMPKLNTMNPEVEKYFCDVCQYWLKEYHIDGWRLDVASEVNDSFWRAFYRAAKKINPEAILIGEVWESAGHWLDGTIFDSAMNYDFRKHCKRFFAEKSCDAGYFDSLVTNMRMRYRKQTVYSELNLLDSHDVTRFLSVCNGDVNAYVLAVVFQMTFPGMPSVFYGDEQGLSGLKEDEYRQPMIWNGNQTVFSLYKKLISLRKEETALREGEYETIRALSGDKLYIYERAYMNEHIRIALNMNPDECTMDLVKEENVLLDKGYKNGILDSMGFVIYRY